MRLEAMQTLGAIIRSRRRELGLTLDALALSVGCHKSYLSQIENDRRPEGAQPSETLLGRIEGALRLSEGRLVRTARWNAMPEEVRTEVRAMESDRRAARRLAALLASRTLDDAHASGELATLVEQLRGGGAGDTDGDSAGRSNGEGAPGEMHASNGAHGGAGAGPGRRGREVELVPLALRAPLINNVRAGYPTEFTDLGYPARVADEYVTVPDLHDPDAFAARVVGDSMAPEYREGDIVVFSPERDAVSGSDCFVRFERDETTTFKRVFFEERHQGVEERHQGIKASRHRAGENGEARLHGSGRQDAACTMGDDAAPGTRGDADQMIRLQPLNPAYPAQTLAREEIAGLYVAVWVIRAAPAALGRGR